MLLKIIQRVTHIICNISWKIFFKYEVKGAENLKILKTGKAIFYANHGGKVDAFLLGSSIPNWYFKKFKGLKLMTYYKFMEAWYGPIIKQIGAFPIYFNKETLSEKLKTTVDELNKDYGLVMFPTGKIKTTCDPKSARPGIAYLAKAVNPMLVPMYITDTHRIHFIDLILRRRKVTVIFGRPFYYNEVGSEADEYLILAGKIMKRACELV